MAETILDTLAIRLSLTTRTMRRQLRSAHRAVQTFRARAVASFRRAQSAVDALGRSIFRLRYVIIAAGIGLLARSFINAAANAEKLQASLDTITKGRGVETFQTLDKWARRMPINTHRAIDTYRLLLAQGLKPSIKQMTILVDTTSALGGGVDVLRGMSRALGQMQTRGKVVQQELNQLSNQGIPAFKILREELGLTAKELSYIGLQGISAGKAIPALFAGLEKRFGGASERFMETWAGLLERMRDAWDRWQRQVMTAGPFQGLKAAFGGVIDQVDRLADDGRLQEWARNTAGFIIDAFAVAFSAIEGFMDLTAGARRVGERLALNKLQSQIRDLTAEFNNLMNERERLENAFTNPSFVQGIRNSLGMDTAETAKTRIAEINQLIPGLEARIKGASNAWRDMKRQIDGAGNGIKSFAGEALDALAKLKGGVISGTGRDARDGAAGLPSEDATNERRDAILSAIDRIQNATAAADLKAAATRSRLEAEARAKIEQQLGQADFLEAVARTEALEKPWKQWSDSTSASIANVSSFAAESFGRIQTGFSNAIGGMIAGTGTFRESMRDLWRGVVQDIVAKIISMTTTWIAQSALKIAQSNTETAIIVANNQRQAASAAASQAGGGGIGFGAIAGFVGLGAAFLNPALGAGIGITGQLAQQQTARSSGRAMTPSKVEGRFTLQDRQGRDLMSWITEQAADGMGDGVNVLATQGA